MKTEKTKILTGFRCTPKLIARIDQAVDGVRYVSRSHLITECVVNFLDAYEQIQKMKKGKK